MGIVLDPLKALARQPHGLTAMGVPCRRRQRRRHFHNRASLWGSFQIHRGGTIDDQIELWRNFLPEQPNRKSIRPGINTPIDKPDIVPRLILAVILKINRRPGAAPELGTGEAREGGSRYLQGITHSKLFALLQSFSMLRAHGVVGKIDGVGSGLMVSLLNGWKFNHCRRNQGELSSNMEPIQPSETRRCSRCSRERAFGSDTIVPSNAR